MLEWLQKLFSNELPPLKYKDLGNSIVEVSCGSKSRKCIYFSPEAVKEIEKSKLKREWEQN